MNSGRRNVYVESTGSGPPLVLLHGFALHGGFFSPLVPALAKKHRVHVVDLPGHGFSAPLAPLDLSTIVAAIDAALPGEGPATVLGWSLGGQVALEWARVRPARVRRAILVASTPSFVQRDGFPHAMSSVTLTRFGDELRVAYAATLRRFLALQMQGTDTGRRTLASMRARLAERGEPKREALEDALALVASVDLRTLLAQVRVPVLVVAGDRDVLVPIQATQALAAALPAAVHRTIAGAAHAPFLSHPVAFAEALAGFLDD